MPLSVSEIRCCIDSLNANSEIGLFPFLAACTVIANTDISFSVSSKNDLPDVTTSGVSPGQLVYVDEIGTFVVSTSTGWSTVDGRVYRKDTPNSTERQLWSWGNAICGALANGSTVIGGCSPIREISSSTNWSCVVRGDTSSFALKTDGSLWGWGQAACGNLANGSTTGRCSPVREMCSDTTWCYINNSVATHAIKTDGSLWAWGFGNCGSIGNGDTGISRLCSPVREFCSATNWRQVSSYAYLSSALKTDGTVWTWGINCCGSLGTGTTSPVASGSPVRERCSATNWCQTSAGYFSVALIKTDGSLWSWGRNTCAQLAVGLGPTGICSSCSAVREFCSATNWCKVISRARTVIAQKTDGSLWGWGSNGCGEQLARIGGGYRCSPVQITNFNDWLTFDSKGINTVALKTDGTAWAWGRNNIGELGTRCPTNLSAGSRPSPVPLQVCYNDACDAWHRVSIGANGISAIKIVDL